MYIPKAFLALRAMKTDENKDERSKGMRQEAGHRDVSHIKLLYVYTIYCSSATHSFSATKRCWLKGLIRIQNFANDFATCSSCQAGYVCCKLWYYTPI